MFLSLTHLKDQYGEELGSTAFPELQYFDWADFACSYTKDIHQIPFEMRCFILWVDRVLRPKCDFPFYITSGHRSEYHPIEAEKAAPGPHQIAAIDILCSHANAYTLIKIATDLGVPRIGVKQHSGVEGRFIHIDPLPATPYRPSPHVWSYP